ncbi:hypothetical protein A3A71_01230 [Candidatus Berkelbacteria bacterium RIFCSPLOWO2_01_FULL_50_28]|uniref:Fimbrial assembly protein n=1 Tax=Candidatus Berkelbacteria bacterium RIFCSPLOWO2_01_FULL_50_28 TaxID=1797471 RepID=A0A1F5EBJ1_9BACT|nr:MAG: hypothetical protein A2807_01800 [Candidatus Berkelbacteria bacterium RIFCSPHIGHO2_01_FULL_50_36]OGD63470.1 MAG: hypothetical protein A3F39_03230 [Candidatus Berkelbacteria bacterium RIFCSPHIGHO2_12_FULL_50_11]OGD64660.1 MAG: hypothetical protein A3A71_01230 [Candidatus Berkelbacteria bacterium RIFCSPLOWO2_01_FULL_50_28]
MSINLVPQETKDRLVAKQAVYKLILVYVFLLLALGAGVAWLTTSKLMKENELQGVKTELANTITQSKQNQSLLLKAAFIENRLQSAASYRESYHWDELLGKIAKSTPANTQITSLKVTTGNKATVSIGGKTATSREVVLFRDKLATIAGLALPVITSINETKTEDGSSFSFTIETTFTPKDEGTK